jgi:UDP-GlcNAc:undecaprenyl-phosphate GlcNAc-1-phosphate transferase
MLTALVIATSARGQPWTSTPLLPLAGAALAALLTFALCLGVMRLCRWRGWLDQPEPRRVHRVPIPRLGGIAIFLAFTLVSLALFRPRGAHELNVYIGLLAAAVLVVAVMAYDDVRGLPPLPRLGVQTVAALIAIYPAAPGTLIQVIHNPLLASGASRTLLPLAIAVPFTWFWLVGMMNTVNWMDGTDGLAGGVVTIAAAVMAAISWMLGQPGPALLCAILAGATLGFLPLNWHPARLFMGDSGAMFLGLALAVLADVGGAKLATVLLLLGVPILDVARVIARRLRQGRSPLRFDRAHLHHRLLAGGFSQRQVALLFYLVTALFGGVTIFAAYLQVHLSTWNPQVQLLPWLNIAASELPALGGLALVAAVMAGILVLTWRRRATLAARRPWPLPPSASGSHHRLGAPGQRG